MRATWRRCWRSTSSRKRFKNYRDLRFLAKNLDDWREKLGDLRRHAGDPAQGLRRQPAAGAGARQQRHRHRGCWSSGARPWPPRSPRGEQAGDGVAFADAKELDLLERREGAAGAIVDAPSADDGGRSRCATGSASPAASLSWQLAQDADRPRSGTLQSELQRIDAELDESQAARRRRCPAAQTRRAGRASTASASASPRSTPLLQRHDPARRRR